MSAMLAWTLVFLLVAIGIAIALRSRKRPAGQSPADRKSEVDKAPKSEMPPMQILRGPEAELGAFPAEVAPLEEATSPQAEASRKPIDPVASETDIDSKIVAAEAGADKKEIARLYIRHAKIHIAAGRREEGASRLRDAIRVAALNNLAEPHALARLELGDLYFDNGDPITACEQWQIARNLFHDIARMPDRDAVDKRMLSNGCPTDWVLTDF